MQEAEIASQSEKIICWGIQGTQKIHNKIFFRLRVGFIWVHGNRRRTQSRKNGCWKGIYKGKSVCIHCGVQGNGRTQQSFIQSAITGEADKFGCLCETIGKPLWKMKFWKWVSHHGIVWPFCMYKGFIIRLFVHIKLNQLLIPTFLKSEKWAFPWFITFLVCYWHSSIWNAPEGIKHQLLALIYYFAFIYEGLFEFDRE